MPVCLLNASERQRLLELSMFEQELLSQGFQKIAGIDEAGRGPLAGPVVAAACILPFNFLIPGINDSKQLTPKQRETLFQEIMETPGIKWGISIISHEIIDKINIYQATLQAMLEAVSQLTEIPEMLLVDGMNLNHPSIPSKKIVGGDARSISIATASIIAKETRDRLMREFDNEWPMYGFAQHKGYGTPQHLEALEKHGPCPIHRITFEPVKNCRL